MEKENTLNTENEKKEHKLSFLLSIIGGLLTIVAIFMPAMNFMGIEASLYESSPDAAIIYIVMALIIVVVGVVKKRWLHILNLFLGLLILFLALKYQGDCTDNGSEIGIGLWVLFLGGVTAFVGSIMGLLKK